MRRRAVIACLLSLSALAWGGGERLPNAELTRFVSPMGIEHLSLRCFPDRTASEGYACELSQSRNGVMLAKAMVAPSAVDAMFRRYFQRVPKDKIQPVASSFEEEPRSRTDLSWAVSSGVFANRGAAARGSKRDRRATIAILALENELSAHFLK